MVGNYKYLEPNRFQMGKERLKQPPRARCLHETNILLLIGFGGDPIYYVASPGVPRHSRALHLYRGLE
jgi:hypothetical protein